jgi:hypothetical protein
MSGKRSKSGIVSWFRKLRTTTTTTTTTKGAPGDAAEREAKAEAEQEVKQQPGLVRIMSLPPQGNLRTWVPAVLLSGSKSSLRRTVSYNSPVPLTPLPLTAKNVAALNASQSLYGGSSPDQACIRCSDDWDRASASTASQKQGHKHGIEGLHEEIKRIPEDSEVAGSSSSPAASQHIPAHTAHMLHTASTDHTAFEGSVEPLSQYIDDLTHAQPHGQSVSSNIHSLQHAVDVVLQENAQLRRLAQGQQQDVAGPYGGTNNEKAMYNAMNAVCVDVVKLQLEVRAKDTAIQKLKQQISSVQQMLQV